MNSPEDLLGETPEFHSLGRLTTKALGLSCEDQDQLITTAMEVFPHPLVVGFTGPGGAGKSTLLGTLTNAVLEQSPSGHIAIFAFDPVSSVSGGALLGDRLRLPAALVTDSRVFFRSLAGRGQQKGIQELAVLAALARHAHVSVVLIETVGAGQDDVAIHDYVDVLVAVFPPVGDAITYMKSGIVEHLDVAVINVLPDTEKISARTVSSLQSALAIGAPRITTVLSCAVNTTWGAAKVLESIHHIRALQEKS